MIVFIIGEFAEGEERGERREGRGSLWNYSVEISGFSLLFIRRKNLSSPLNTPVRFFFLPLTREYPYYFLLLLFWEEDPTTFYCFISHRAPAGQTRLSIISACPQGLNYFSETFIPEPRTISRTFHLLIMTGSCLIRGNFFNYRTANYRAALINASSKYA